jgi:hypothetical protein
MWTLKGGNKHASTSSTSASSAAANLNQKRQICSPSDNVQANQWSDFGSDGDTAACTRSQLTMLQRVNLHKAGLCQSPCLKELVEKNATHHKAHVTWASKAMKVVTLLSIFLFVADIRLPSFPISPQATLCEKMVTRIHEVNELYDGTLNTIHAYAFNTVALDMSNNKIFTYTNAMQQPDLAQFVEAMAKEIHDHESRDHWEIVRPDTIPSG